jgi:hypothetical protein
MRYLAAKPAPRSVLLSSFALIAVLFTIFASSASASSWNEWHGRNLPGHTWTTGNGVVQPKLWRIDGGANTTSSVCIGPVTHDAGGYHFPYGWTCGKTSSTWTIYPTTIEAADGLYNPNSGTFGEYGAVGISE